MSKVSNSFFYKLRAIDDKRKEIKKSLVLSQKYSLAFGTISPIVIFFDKNRDDGFYEVKLKVVGNQTVAPNVLLFKILR